jgi:acylglycerol kinase
LNPYAAGGKARKLFEKNAAPVLHVAGMDVTVVETSSYEQLPMLMDYVPSDVDGVVVAGGRGTMLEVISGLLRRKDKERPLNVPLGYIPLGESQNDVVTLLGIQDADKVVETCKAALAVVKGHTRSIDLMQIQPEGGKPVFAMHALEWGILHDINERTPKFWWTGMMRQFCACLEAVLKVYCASCILLAVYCSVVNIYYCVMLSTSGHFQQLLGCSVVICKKFLQTVK